MNTIVKLLRHRAAERPDERLYTFLSDDGSEEQARVTYGELDRRARAIAVLCHEAGLSGLRAVLVYPPGLDYVAAFFGCLYAGVVAVPAYPPDPSRLARTLPRLQAIIADAGAEAVLTTGMIAASVDAIAAVTPELGRVPWLATDTLDDARAETWREPELTPSSLAFLQYTSGSTDQPKGVMLTHGNLLANERLIRSAFACNEDSIGLGWLPLYHDMGLIGNVLQPLYGGFPCVLMSPLTFLRRPAVWLEAITRYRATMSGGPNFAYDLCVRKIAPAAREALDLRSWCLAFNGAEPVRSATMDRFAEAFASCGFSRRAFYPCYGLAEATLIVSGGTQGDGPSVATADDKTLVSSGRALDAVDIAIVDPESRRRCPPDHVGEIWVRGASVAAGYWKQPEASAAAFGARLHDEQTDARPTFLRTGDLGFLRAGELFVTGRIKDVIIVRGRNVYPHDIEATVEQAHAVVRPGCVAAFSVDVDGEERLVVVAEVGRDFESADATEIRRSANEAIRRAITDAHQLAAHAIAFLRAGAIFKTSSGKIQRQACRAAFLEGRLEAIADAVSQSPSPTASPTSPIEERLRDELAAILRIPATQVDLSAPLNALGLDSLMAIEASHTLEQKFGTEVPVTSFLQDIDGRELAARIQTSLAEGKTAASLAPRAVSSADFALTSGQEALWFLHQLAPESSAYNMGAALRITGNLVTSALEESLRTLVRRHGSLHTTYADVGQRPRQRLRPELAEAFLLEAIEARDLDAADLAARVEDAINAPFDLVHGPVFRAALFLCSASEHVLVLSAHHIAADLWSIVFLLSELRTVYTDIAAGRAPLELPVPSTPYRDFVDWQQEYLERRGELDWKYWQGRIAGREPLELPADRPRPHVQTYRGAAHRVALSGERVAQLASFAKREGVTTYVVLLSAFEILLARYSGQDDFLVGSPVAGRAHSAFRRTVGYFVNPLPLPADLRDRPTFEELVRRTRRTVLAGLEHQDFPFALAVQRSGGRRDPSRSPLFQAMFVLEKAYLESESDLTALLLDAGSGSVPFADLAVSGFALEQRSAQFDLTLSLTQTAGSLSGIFEYNADLFDEATIARLARHFDNVLAGALSRPTESVFDLPLLGPEEENELLVAWNRTHAELDADRTIHDLFVEQAERTPEALAVVQGNVAWTYAELRRRAEGVASTLVAAGASPAAFVAVSMDRTPHAVSAILGVLLTGAAYVPIDPGYPMERVEAMLADCGAQIAVTDGRILPGVVTIDATSVADHATWRRAPAGSAAYLIYTSGSSGAPKGVVVEHRSAVNYLKAFGREIELGPGDRLLQFASLSFDVSVEEIFGAIAFGATLVLRTDAMLENVEAFTRACAESKITVLDVPTAYWNELAMGLPAGRPDLFPASVRCVVIGGEKAQREALNRWRQVAPARVRVLNAYGPTETTISATWADLSTAPTSIELPIGKPVANTLAYVVDESMRPTPIGVAGELVIGGVNVARGYLNRPELTAERFVPNPFGDGRLYRTGDKAAWRADGQLSYRGRLDRQVKVRGFRIEPGEIESALCRHPGVREALVVDTTARDGAVSLVAYVVGDGVSADDLRARLRSQVPEYMLPSAIVVLEAFPRTVNGKVDRAALPAPEHRLAGFYVPPRNAREMLLVRLWQEVLQLERVGVTDDFFELGGHSLSATQLASRVRKELNVDLALRELFEAPTVEALARALDDRVAPSRPALIRHPRQASEPLSLTQRRLWFIDQLEASRAIYTNVGAARLRGRLNVTALERALAGVVRRHESLRTVFIEEDGSPRQVLLAEMPLTVARVEGTRIEALVRSESSRRFDLTRGPLIRVTLLAEGAESHVLVVAKHHIISDAWSTTVLVRHLSEAYAAEAAGQPYAPAPLPVDYADWSNWQHAYVSSIRASESTFWRDQLHGAPELLQLPTDRPRPATMNPEGAVERLRLSAATQARLHDLCRRERVTPFMVLLAAFQTLLARYSGQVDIVTGTPVAGRTHEETEDLIGFFVNTLAIRTQFDEADTVSSLLKKVRETVLGAFAHQDLPFDEIVEDIAPARSSSFTPIFQTAFALQNTNEVPSTFGDLRLEMIATDSLTATFDLTLFLTPHSGGVDGYFEYRTDLFDAATIRRMARHYQRAVELFVSDTRAAISTLELLSTVEREQVLRTFNATALPFDDWRSIPERLSEQAACTPDRLALTFEGASWSYRELEARSNQLAHRLRRLGVTHEARVGVCMDRSLELVVSLLAVMKAGGAYVPLDPGYPAERLAFMAADSRIDVLLAGPGTPRALPAEGCTRVLVDVTESWREPTTIPGVAYPGASACYVIYTSGSTGRPKGAVNTHAGLLNRIQWMQATFELTTDDAVVQKTPFSFDVSVWEFFWPLTVGARLVIARPEGHKDPDYLAELFAQQRITTAHFVPPMLDVFLEATTPRALDGLRRIICSGEALTFELQERFFQKTKSVELHNLYGPTEAAIDVTWWPCERNSPRRSVPIGKAISNTQAYVLDSHGAPVPPGVAGELHLGGVQVGRGYWERPALTAERFVPDPYGLSPGGRLYKTGDSACYRSDGTIEYLGRLDHQVKLRGLRIELGEIESALDAHPAVSQSVVLADGQRLVAYLVPDAERAPVLLRTLAREDCYELPNGLPVVHKKATETDFLYREIFEGHGYLKHGIELGAGAVVFDVGANIGMFSVFIGDRFPDATIYAFEPIPPLYELLHDNCELLGLNAKTFDVALGKAESSESFVYYPENSVLSGRFVDEVQDREVVRRFLGNEQTEADPLGAEDIARIVDASLVTEQFTCSIKPLSRVLAEQGIDHVDLLKIDVEKAECDVLAGIDAADWPKIRQIVVEVHDIDGRLGRVIELLESHGFSWQREQEALLEGTVIHSVYARRPNLPRATPAPARRTAPRWLTRTSLLQDLGAALSARLPEHMIPSAFVLLERFPLTPNGKLDRKALPSPDQAARSKDYVAPRDALEHDIACIWRDVLHVERVSVMDDFFRIGGHSLLATQVASRVRKGFGIEMSVGELFEARTVADLAQRLRGRAADAGPALVRRAPHAKVTPSFAQERLWFLDRVNPGGVGYNLPGALRLKGTLEPNRLERSIAEVVRRHESLRTTFHDVDGELELRIHDDCAVPVEVTDVTSESDAREILRAEAIRPFDLSSGPLLRARLVRLAADEHVLVFTMHHIVSDGWSIGVLMHEITTLYSDRASLPELTIQYSDYAAWQRQRLEGAELERQLSYWKGRLGHVPHTIQLPFDHVPNVNRKPRGAALVRHTDARLKANIRAVSVAGGATEFMAMLAAFAATMSGVSGQHELIIGTGIANRIRRETEPLIGFFVNSAALGLRVGNEQTFEALLADVKDVTLGAYAHQEVPFQKVVEALKVARDPSRATLIQVMFALQNEPRSELDLPGLEITVESVPTDTTNFELVVAVTPTDNGYTFAWEYRADLFEPATIESWAESFETFLEDAVRRPKRTVAQLRGALQGEDQRDTLHALFDSHVERAPDSIALSSASERLTYRELDAQSNLVADALAAAEVPPESAIGIYMLRSTDFVIAALGILKAGATYVPLDPSYPISRLAQMVSVAKVKVVMASTEVATAEGLGRPVLRLAACMARAPKANPRGRNVHPGALAHVMFTSGSTGNPKGVGITHRSIIGLVRHTNYIELKATDCVAHGSNTSFDASTFEIWGALLNGARLHLIEHDVMLSPAELKATLEREHVTVMLIPTALFHRVIQESPNAFASLDTLLFGGEAADPRAVRLALERRPRRLLNAYGPTEATTMATWHEVATLADDATTVPIGIPLAGVRCHVLDADLSPVSTGDVGELYVGGGGVARGYVNDPAATANVFVPDPWSPQPGARLYKTGDLVRLRADGRLEFVGRADRQTKLRGFRVELGDVETALRGCPGVRDAVALVREDEPGDKRLVAYVAGDLDADIVREHGRTLLPKHMLPSAVVVLPVLPLTPGGKVDRKALPMPARSADTARLVLPRTQREKALAQVWQDVLRIDRVGIHENFFAVGGDSMLALRVVARAATAGVSIRVRDLLEHQTIAELADLGPAEGASPVSASSATIAPAGPVPLTPFQALHLGRANPAHVGQWNMGGLLRFGASLPIAFVVAAVDAVTRREESLHFRFVRHEDRWEQLYPGAPTESLVEVVDLAGEPEETCAAELSRRAHHAQTSLDVTHGPVARFIVFDLGPERDRRLLLVMHWLVIDIVSFRVIAEQVHSAIMQQVRGEPIALPPRGTTFIEWARSRHIDQERLREALAYWLTIAKKPLPRLPLELEGGPNTYGSGRVALRTFSTEQTRRVLVAAAKRTLSPSVLLAAAYAWGVRQWCGKTEVLLALTSHGRDWAEPGVDLSHAVGRIAGFFPAYLDVAGCTDEHDALRSVAAQIAAIPHGGATFASLHALELDPRDAEALRRLTTADTRLDYTGQALERLDASDHFDIASESAGETFNPARVRNVVFFFGPSVTRAQLHLDLHYSTSQYQAATVEALLDAIASALLGMVSKVSIDADGDAATPDS
jgi:amino acid adenylation domain-containing protein/FkbM family methyltransferase